MTECNIAIFGGSFDPIHEDHTRLLHWLANDSPVGLTKILVAVVDDHAFGKDLAPYPERAKMVQMMVDALAPDSLFGMVKSRKIEVVKQTEKYTVDFLARLRLQYSEGPDQVLKVTTIPLNHPNGCLGYRIEYMRKVLVYATDLEPLRFPNHQVTKHGEKADLLITDGQYTDGQLGGMVQTFGHGSPRSCVEQAVACKAKHLVVHPHDPNSDDDALGAMEADALVYAGVVNYDRVVEFARQDTVWNL